MTQKQESRGRSFEIAPDKLTPYDRNARKHSDKQITMICDSITEFGFLKPVLIDESKMILAGHGAVLAAIKLERSKIPVRQISGLSDEQKRGYIIADNRASELSTWDWNLLALELDDLKSMDMNLSPVGFADFGSAGVNGANGQSQTIGGDRFLLQLEFETEKEMQIVYEELHKREISIKVLQ